MSGDADVTRAVRQWIKEDVASPSDRIVDAVLNQIPVNRQRRALGPADRFRPITTPIRVALAAAVAAVAVAAVAVSGLDLLPRDGGIGGPAPTVDLLTQAPSPAVKTPAPTASASPSIPYVITGPTSGPGRTAVMPGTYRLRGPGSYPVGWPSAVIVTIPDQWWARSAVRGAGLVRGESDDSALAALDVSSVGDLMARPCGSDSDGSLPIQPPIGPSVDDLVAALNSRPGLEFVEPVDITVDGWPGVRLELTPASGCGPATLWRTPSEGETWEVGIGEGWRSRIEIIDVNGLRLVVLSSYQVDAPADVQLELEQMVDSIAIEP